MKGKEVSFLIDIWIYSWQTKKLTFFPFEWFVFGVDASGNLTHDGGIFSATDALAFTTVLFWSFCALLTVMLSLDFTLTFTSRTQCLMMKEYLGFYTHHSVRKVLTRLLLMFRPKCLFQSRIKQIIQLWKQFCQNVSQHQQELRKNLVGAKENKTVVILGRVQSKSILDFSCIQL